MPNTRTPGRATPAMDGPLGRSPGGRFVERAVRFLGVPAALRWTGLPQLVSFYRYFAFAGPRTTTGVAVVLTLALAAATAKALATGDHPAYATAGLGVVAAAVLATGWGVLRGRRWGWWLGSVTAVAWVVGYVVVRAPGLPGLAGTLDRWDDPVSTIGVAVAAAFVALHFAVLTGVLVAYPSRRTWQD